MPIKYVPFIPEPVEGQAVLGNFNRILKYKGADDVSMTIQRGMPLYEMEKQETVGENADGNMVIRGECVSACAYLKEQGIQVDLVYIDPPFASGADYAKKVYIRRNPKVAEAIAQAEQELDIDELKAFEEKMYGDVWDKEKYLNWMYENLMAIKSVMKESATLYVHLDWHIGHYVKILLDEVFGEDNFLNEIVWGYKDIGAKAVPYFKKKHDTIYVYQKSDTDNGSLGEDIFNRFIQTFNNELMTDFYKDMCDYWLEKNLNSISTEYIDTKNSSYHNVKVGNVTFDFACEKKQAVYACFDITPGGKLTQKLWNEIENSTTKKRPFYENEYIICTVNRVPDSFWTLSKRYDNVHIVSQKMLFATYKKEYNKIAHPRFVPSFV